VKFLLEIGCEEIPARFIPPALAALEEGFRKHLGDVRLDAGDLSVSSMGTPRRLVLLADNLKERQEDLEEELLGPRVEAAFDKDGKPTKACLGFAKSKGVEVADLLKVDSDKGQVVAVRRSLKGQPAAEVLPESLVELLGSLPFQKTMRWGEGKHLFARPVHWILALIDDQVLPFSFAGVESGNNSRGHRFTSPDSFEVKKIESYESDLKKRDVVVDPQARREMLMEASRKLAKEAGGRLLDDPGLEEEVTYLTEMPVPVLGRFDQKFLKLPREILVAAMRNHQRYFSIEDQDGKLLDAFVAVGNTRVEDPALVRHGNERVLTARLSDAGFFFEVDKKVPPVDRVPKLQEMTFQADLGSYYAKAHRMANLAVSLAVHAGLGEWNEGTRIIDALTVKMSSLENDKEQFSWRVARAALLSKTDLLTEMVGEFPELQGEMGGVYAENAGEHPPVARAVRDHYRPRFSGDSVPGQDEGAMVSLADRLDTLAGCFGVGLKPTGAADPYALRRQCLGVIAIVMQKDYRLSLRWMLERAVSGVYDRVEAARLQKARQKEEKRAKRKKTKPKTIDKVEPFEEQLVDDLMAFFAGRLRQRFADHARMDIVDAVLSAGMDDMTEAAMRVKALGEFSQQPAFEDLAVAFKRAANIIKDFDGGQLDQSLLEQAEERDLHQVYLAVAPRFEEHLASRDFASGMNLLATKLRGPVDRFFDAVLVNDPDHPEQQANRKALLAQIEALFGRIADFTRLQLKT
jgi:glycyl-tRNA synthetase beta chain